MITLTILGPCISVDMTVCVRNDSYSTRRYQPVVRETRVDRRGLLWHKERFGGQILYFLSVKTNCVDDQTDDGTSRFL